MLSVYHMTAFTIGFVMDLLFGDPYWLPHPIPVSYTHLTLPTTVLV